MNYISKILIAIILMTCFARAQNYIFFSDSPNNIYYDASWGFAQIWSAVERYNGDKFPVSTDHFYSGLNSLKLRWTSREGGDWGMAVAEWGWPGHDVTVKDSITFFVYSDSGINALSLPKLYIEDLNNIKTPKINLSDYTSNIAPQVWTKISIPLQVFINNPGSADLTKIKTIFYGQSISDSIEHILYIDEIRMVAISEIDTISPSTPLNISAKGYAKHIDIFWDENPETDLASYYIYRFEDNTYTRIGVASKDVRIFTDFINQEGVTATYKVTAVDSSSNESEMSSQVTASTQAFNDEEMLTMLQEASFRYFWDYAHPVSGLARERIGSDDVVTTGGSGFGIMAILVAIERGFITREEGIQRVLKILNFLSNADRFHGAWPHWMNGTTGNVIPFSQYDNGGDLVETAFMIQGLLTLRQYFNQSNSEEDSIRTLITNLWESVEWDWYRQTPTSNFLYWHWSPDFGWQINFRLQGPNEVMITYLLAIASPAHSIPASLYTSGWASSPNYVNGNSFYGYPLYVGWDYGGPLFFAHYSFLGFDPRFKRDAYANYFYNNRNHTLINRAYCIDNPNSYVGYNENTWGLTASDDPFGYLAHEPDFNGNRDNGTISPTAALSSMPYTPEESMAAFRNMYDTYGENIWGPFGFKDAFNPTQDWFANSYLAIDQGPIIVMIENYRTGLLWNNFMANPEIKPMLNAIGFVPDSTTGINDEDIIANDFKLIGNYPNPFNPSTIIVFSLPGKENVRLSIYNFLGEKVRELFAGELERGVSNIYWDGRDNSLKTVSSGIYFYRLKAGEKLLTGKMVLQK